MILPQEAASPGGLEEPTSQPPAAEGWHMACQLQRKRGHFKGHTITHLIEFRTLQPENEAPGYIFTTFHK